MPKRERSVLTSPHKIVLVWQGGELWPRLVHPENGRCPVDPERPHEGCVLESWWYDHEHELVEGTVELEVEDEWADTGDRPVLRIVGVKGASDGGN